MTMVMDTLECNPPFCMTKSVLSEILRWVCILFHYVNQFIVISPYRSKYTQSLERNPPPHAWDQNKRRTIEYRVDHDNDLRWDEVMTLMKYYSLNTHTFIKLSWAEYVFIFFFSGKDFLEW